MKFLILILFIGIGKYAFAEDANNDIDTAPENLDDRDDMSERESCTVGESCDYKRTSSCINEPDPQKACGQKIWKEEFFGCFDCVGGQWLDGSTWSKCSGTGCNDTVQKIERKCANLAASLNCRSVQTKFCDPTKVCDGTWTEWKSDSPKCQDLCGNSRYRVLFRVCTKEGQSSVSCANDIKLKETDFEHCTNNSCQTTTTETTTTTTPSTTTRRATSLTAWSKWEGCTATCTVGVGTEKRMRKCVYDDKREAPESSCGRHMMTDERKCVLNNPEKCKMEKSVGEPNMTPKSTAKATKSTTKQTISNKSSSGGDAEKRSFIINPSPDSTTKSLNMTLSTTERLGNTQGVNKYEIRVLIIVLATTALLILLVVVIYICCSKRRKKSTKKRKINSISVVGLQSHTGFMDGMESYGFTKSMMPKGDFMEALNPKSQSTPELSLDTYKTRTPNRELPDIPVEEQNHVNQNSHHIYEEMRHPDIAPNRSWSVVAKPNRSKSYHERRRRANTLMSSGAELQPLRRQSCFTLQPKRSPPVKPPRKSMLVSGSGDINANREMRDVPRALYESKEKLSCPDLDFIHDIQPPTTSPPITPLDNDMAPANRFLTLPNMGNKNSHMISTHSAPASPNHYPLSPMQQTQYYACMPNSLLVPYGAMPIMAPMQNQNGEVVYMPLTPVHMPQTPQPTPLHGAVVPMRTNSQNPRTPSKTPVLPQISISEADKNHLSPQRATRSPNSGDYAEMRHMPSISAMSDFEDADSCFIRSKSFRQLHGTHDQTKSSSQDSEDSFHEIEEPTENDKIFPLEENEDLYLTPNTPRTPVA